MFKKTCSACETQANQDRAAAALDERKKKYEDSLADAQAVCPGLADVWKKMHELSEAKWIADVGKSEKTFTPISDDLPRLIPKNEAVVAAGTGVSGTSSATWVVTTESLVIELRSIWNGEHKASEVIALKNITGIENKVFNKVHNDREIIVTRAANTDHLSVVKAKVAEMLVEAINGGKNASATNSTTPKASDPAEAIRKLKGLLDDGLISQDEFDKKKADLIDKM